MNREECIRDIKNLLKHELNDISMDSRIQQQDYIKLHIRHSDILKYLQENLK